MVAYGHRNVNTHKERSRMNDLELGYVAGIIDGEGWLGYRQKLDRRRGCKYGMLRIQVTMTDEDVIRRLHSITGIGSVRFIDRSKLPNRQNVWQWSVLAGQAAVDLLKQVQLVVGDRRAEKIRELLGYKLGRI